MTWLLSVFLYTGVDDMPGWQMNESTPEPFSRRTISLFDMMVISLDVPYALMSLVDARSPLSASTTAEKTALIALLAMLQHKILYRDVMTTFVQHCGLIDLFGSAAMCTISWTGLLEILPLYVPHNFQTGHNPHHT